MLNFKTNIVRAILFLYFLCHSILSGQTNYDQRYCPFPTTLAYKISDSTAEGHPNVQSSKLSAIKKTKSTVTAMLFSAVLPGSGQFYNESYWKVPVILGLGGYWGYEWAQMNNELRIYKSKYSESLVSYPPAGNYRYKNLRDFYRSERDKFAWYLGLLYFLNIVDAYVDASLFEFSVSEDLSAVHGTEQLKLKLEVFF
jgi:hypothetical protein